MARRSARARAAGGQSVRLPLDIVEAARIVAAYQNRSMSSVLSEILRPALAAIEAEERARRGRPIPPENRTYEHK